MEEAISLRKSIERFLEGNDETVYRLLKFKSSYQLSRQQVLCAFLRYYRFYSGSKSAYEEHRHSSSPYKFIEHPLRERAMVEMQRESGDARYNYITSPQFQEEEEDEEIDELGDEGSSQEDEQFDLDSVRAVGTRRMRTDGCSNNRDSSLSLNSLGPELFSHDHFERFCPLGFTFQQTKRLWCHLIAWVVNTTFVSKSDRAWGEVLPRIVYSSAQ